MPTDRRPPAAVEVARALGDPARFRLLRVLAGRDEVSCAELTRRLRLAQATVSHHLKVLARAGLVSARREGPFHYYRLHREVLAAHRDALARAFAPRPRAAATRRSTKGAAMKRLVPVLLALAPALAAAEATTWKIDPSHTQTTFAVRHLVISTVRGEFKATNGVVRLDPADPSKSSVEATIDAATIHTREDKRDDHLRSADFLDVERHPTITFRSTRVEKKGEDRFAVTGDLTIRGTTRPVVLDTTVTPEIEDMQGMTRRGLQARTRIDRRDFGVRWSKAVEAGPVVGDEIDVEINAEIVKAADGAVAPAATKGGKAR